jgi:hypothetical protein
VVVWEGDEAEVDGVVIVREVEVGTDVGDSVGTPGAVLVIEGSLVLSGSLFTGGRGVPDVVDTVVDVSEIVELGTGGSPVVDGGSEGVVEDEVVEVSVVDTVVEESELVADVVELVKGGSTVVDGGSESVVEDEGVEVGSLPKGGRGLPVVVVDDSVLVTDAVELITGGSTVVDDGSESVDVDEGMGGGSLSTGGRGVGPG